MKQKDMILIGFVVFISGVFAYIISNTFISPAKNRKADVEVVEKISSEFTTPSTKYFNEQSNDPTKLIQIGDNPNASPFQ